MLPFSDAEVANNEAVRAASALGHARMHHLGGTSWKVYRQAPDADDADGLEGPRAPRELKFTVQGYVVQETQPQIGPIAAGVAVVGGPWVFIGEPGLDIQTGDDLVDATTGTYAFRVESVATTNITRAVLKTPGQIQAPSP